MTPRRPCAAPSKWIETMTMTYQDFRCFHRLRVCWAEVDIQKIVFNAHYLTYAD